METRSDERAGTGTPPGAIPRAGGRSAPWTDAPGGARHALPVLHTVFFISGFCALVYQVAWQRMLGLFGGSDTVSATIVVGAFLFGLGVGSLAGGVIADRLSRSGAVVAFALCELGIAACAALSPYVFYDLVFGHLVGIARSHAVVLGVVFAALLPPTLLMGLSLPLLSRAVVRDIEGAAERIGWLYGLNTFGAGLGALVAGTLVIGTVGYEATVYGGAVFNAAVGTAALFVARAVTAAGATRPEAARVRTAASASARRLWGWCALVFASGFLIISLEIVWFRVLGTLAATNAYAFPLILGVFLVADAAGIVAGARVVRGVADPRRFFLRLQGAVALYALGTLAALWAAHGVEDVARLFIIGMIEQEGRRNLLVSGLAWLGVVGVAVAPPAFLLGMSFPIAQKAVQEDPSIVGLRVGVVQLANILGNTAGAVVTGLALLHLLGTAGTLRAIGALGLLLFGLVFLGDGRPRPRQARDFGFAAALAALVALFPGNPAFWARLHSAAAGPEDGATVAEDRTGVVVVRPSSSGTWMFIGGHTQSRLPFLPVHGTLGVVGPLVHPRPRSVLVIGHAIGGTPYAAALATTDASARVRVIEIVAPVYEAVEAYAARPGDAPTLRAMLADPRIERRVGDGRHAIFADEARYDVIQADALLPRSAHSGLLYSVAFFRQVRDRLAPGGIAVQWAPTPRSEASFLHAFPHVVRLEDVTPGASASALLIGGADGPVPFERAALARRFDAVEPGLAAAGWPTGQLREAMLAAPVRVWGPGDPRPADVNTDLFPKDEYFLNRWKLDLPGHGAAAR